MPDLDYMLAKPSRRGDGVPVVPCEPCDGSGFLPGDHACFECSGGERHANELHLAYTLIEVALECRTRDPQRCQFLLMEAQTALTDAAQLVAVGHSTAELEKSAATRAPAVWDLVRQLSEKTWGRTLGTVAS